MIHNALNYVIHQLNDFLMRRFSVQETKAILGSIVDESGSVPKENENKIILSLVNMEHETNHQFAVSQQTYGNKSLSENLPFNFNLDVLVTAIFSDYNEALKFLSETIYFFQARHLFTHENSPGLDPELQKLTFEVAKVNYSEMQNLWTALGTKYMPSVLFKMRMLSFQSSQISAVDSLINGIDEQLKPQF